MRKWTWIAVAVLGIAGAIAGAARGPERAGAVPVSAEFALLPLWDDGKAEFTIYDTVGKKYGVERRYETRVIVVKEDLVRGALVKSDAGPVPGKTFPVLKMNYVHDIPTGTYTYHQMVTVFFDRQTLRPVKLAMGSMESCGLTYVVAKPRGTTLEHVSHSYWDGEADRTLSFPWGEDAVLYDALPVWLRGLNLAAPAAYEVRLLASQLTSRLGNPAPVPAKIVVGGREGPPSMTSRGQLRVDVRHEGKEDRFWFHPGLPHLLLRWERGDGSVLVLRKTLRLAYWEEHDPGDEALLQ